MANGDTVKSEAVPTDVPAAPDPGRVVHETSKESTVLRTQQATEPFVAAPSPAPECGRMSVDRRDRRRGTLLTLAGEIDLDTAPQLHQAVQECLREGIHVIEIDLAGVTFCDISGLNAFLDAVWLTTAAGGCLRLGNLCPMLTRLLALTETQSLLAIRISDDIRGMPLAGVRIDEELRGDFLSAPRSPGHHDQ
jgi:anti-sigma B factor antagonist